MSPRSAKNTLSGLDSESSWPASASVTGPSSAESGFAFLDERHAGTLPAPPCRGRASSHSGYGVPATVELVEPPEAVDVVLLDDVAPTLLDGAPVPTVVDGRWIVVEVEVDGWGLVVVVTGWVVDVVCGTTDTGTVTCAGEGDRTSR